MSEIQDLFRTPLYKTTLSLDNKSIQSYCTSLASQSKGRLLTNDGGWQSNDLSLKEPPLQPFYKDITYHAHKFLETLEFNGVLSLYNVWVNINGYKNYNNLHKHDHSFLSGVVYIQTPKNCGNIIFHRPGIDVFTYDWNNQTNFNLYNSATRWQRPMPSMLYLFPGWLQHLVEPNMNKKEKRISISFNLSFKAS